MDKIKEYIADWAIYFFKHKDIILKNIESIEKDIDNYDLYIKYKYKEQFIFIEPFIGDIDTILKKIIEDKNITLVTINSKKNFDLIIKGWKQLNQYPKFNIIFVNPFSQTDHKWVLNPYTHDKITEKESFLLGLKSLFSSVQTISKGQIEKNIKYS